MSNDQSSKSEPSWNVPVEPEKPFMFAMTVPVVAQFLFPKTRLAYFGRLCQKIGIAKPFLSSTSIFGTKYINNGFLMRSTVGFGLLFAGFQIIASAITEFDANEESSEKTELVTNGIFKYLRHPIYAGSILMQFGVSFLFDNGTIGILTALYFAWLQAIVLPIEEKGCVEYFGDEYKQYMKQTKRWYLF